MKKIIIIDGGPRRNMNTAQMLQKSAELEKEAMMEFSENGSLTILTICRGDAIVPFRDCLLRVFPEIDYIEVPN